MMKKIHIYRRNYKIQVYTIISVTFKLHTFCNILQINKLYIVSTETAGTPTGHEARFVFVLLFFFFLLKSHSEKLLSRGSPGEFSMSRVHCISVILWIHIFIDREQGVFLFVPQFPCSEDVSHTLMQIYILTLGLDHVNPVES